MKILHTADWHLGHRLHERSQHEEHSLFLNWLKAYIEANDIDVLLLSGDVFDTGVPSSTSQKMYYDFLVSLRETNCVEVIITGGNHDSPGTINAPKELLSTLSVKVVGKAEKDLRDEVFKLTIKDEQVVVAAVPYLRDQDIRKAVAGESFDDLAGRYRKALTNHYDEIATYCDEQRSNCPVIAMGHLFAMGGKVSDSEQNIYVGNLGHIADGDFSSVFDYVALGHLHRPQKVGEREHIRYSGSPVILSFSEINYGKRILVVNTNKDKITEIESVKVPRFRDVLQVNGSVEQCIAELKNIKPNSYGLTPWVEVVLEDDSNTMDYSQIMQEVKELPLDVLKTSRNTVINKGLEKRVNQQEIKELSPVEVFKMKCLDQDFDLEKNSHILDAFEEALQIAQEN